MFVDGVEFFVFYVMFWVVVGVLVCVGVLLCKGFVGMCVFVEV